MFFLELQQLHTYHTRNHYMKGQNQRFTITWYMSQFIFFTNSNFTICFGNMSGPRLQGLNKLSFLSEVV
jgi:hypothetical protein